MPPSDGDAAGERTGLQYVYAAPGGMDARGGGGKLGLGHELAENGEQFDLCGAWGGYVYRAVAHNHFHMLVLRLDQFGGQLLHHFPTGLGGSASRGIYGRGDEQDGYEKDGAFHGVSR